MVEQYRRNPETTTVSWKSGGILVHLLDLHHGTSDSRVLEYVLDALINILVLNGNLSCDLKILNRVLGSYVY